MIITQVPKWAGRCILTGVFLQIVGFMFLKEYSPYLGLWTNVMQQDVLVPFLWGQNPVICTSEGVQSVISIALGFHDATHSYACQFNTLLPYRYIFGFGLFLIAYGIYLFFRGNQIANLWPTEWAVFDNKNVNKTGKVKLKMENPEDRPINPRDGGF